NMLASVTLPDSSVHSYAYDYRVRRITRTEGSTTPVAMTFSGGLSVAEFEVLDPGTGTLNTQPTVEYQRGPDMGGGVGGLLYSLRSGTAKFNLSNGRGDVVAQSDSSGSLTWTASYEAYGKRPVETGSNLDRQRANTKEEDPTGLVNEGFRYRDLETGVWLSRDPAGFVDGPNLYAYCVQNPWTKFDPDGLRWRMTGFGITIEFGAHQPYGIGLYAARPSDADFCDVNLTDFKEGGKRLDALKRSPGEFLKGAAGGFLGTDWGSNTEEGRKGRSVGGNVAVLDAAASMGRAGVAGMSGRSGPPPVPVGTGGVAVAPVAVPKEIPTPLIPANTLFQQTEESQQPTESTKNTLVDYKEIVRRFLSKRDAKDAVKNGIPFDPNKGAGISTTTTTIEPVDPDAIRKMTGAANADFYIDINITGKARLNTVTKGGKADIKIQEDIKPEDVIDKGRVRKSNESVIDNE
ncbi:RHS repeat-associated protein, partial [Roseimicrobium gellanilyticum]